jgi:hypothetical protein
VCARARSTNGRRLPRRPRAGRPSSSPCARRPVSWRLRNARSVRRGGRSAGSRRASCRASRIARRRRRPSAGSSRYSSPAPAAIAALTAGARCTALLRAWRWRGATFCAKRTAAAPVSAPVFAEPAACAAVLRATLAAEAGVRSFFTVGTGMRLPATFGPGAKARSGMCSSLRDSLVRQKASVLRYPRRVPLQTIGVGCVTTSFGGYSRGMPFAAAHLEVPQPGEPATPVVPDAPVTPAVPDPGTPAAPEEPSTVPAPEEPATPAVPEPGPAPTPEPAPSPEPATSEVADRRMHNVTAPSPRAGPVTISASRVLIVDGSGARGCFVTLCTTQRG